MTTYIEALNEVLHISYDARVWTDIIYKIVKNTKEKEIVIYGEEYPKAYEKFPVDYFVLTINNDFGAGGAYNEEDSGLQNGKYCVYLMLSPDLEPYVLNHELRHAYEDFKRISRGHPGMSKSKEGINLFSGDFADLLTGKIKGDFNPFPEVIRALYYTSKLEESGYSETANDLGVKIIWTLEDIVKKDYKDVYKISGWRSGKFNPENNWREFKEKVKIPILDKFNNYQDFLNWADKHIKYRGNKCLKKFRKIVYFRTKNKKK